MIEKKQSGKMLLIIGLIMIPLSLIVAEWINNTGFEIGTIIGMVGLFLGIIMVVDGIRRLDEKDDL